MEAIPESDHVGTSEEAAKYIFRFKVDIRAKKRRRGERGAGPHGAGPPVPPIRSSSPPPPAPGGIERYLSKTRIKLLRDKHVEERKQQQEQLQSILKQHEELKRHPPISPSLLPPSLRHPVTDEKTSEPAVTIKSNAFDVATFLSEANAGTVHPLGAGLFHKKRPEPGATTSSSSSSAVPSSRHLRGGRRAKDQALSDDGEDENRDIQAYNNNAEYDKDDQDEEAVMTAGSGEAGGGNLPTAERRAAAESDEDDEGWPSGAVVQQQEKNKKKEEQEARRWLGAPQTVEPAEVRAAQAAATDSAKLGPFMMGGKRLATAPQFFPHTPPALAAAIAAASSASSSSSSFSQGPSSSFLIPSSSSSSFSSPSFEDSPFVPTMLPLRHQLQHPQQQHHKTQAPPSATHKSAGGHEQARGGEVSSWYQRQPARPPAGAPVVPLRHEGRHLSFIAEGLTLMKLFEHYIWNYTPLHPSILHESSVRRVLSASEDDNGTPLALSVNVALASASFWLGNAKRGNDFYRVARHHLAYLFDSSNYEVAEALIGMCIIAFGRGDMRRFGYFVHLAGTICRRIGAYNSDIYAKCVIATALDPLCPPEEKARLLANYHAKAPVHPYYDSTRAVFPEHMHDVEFGERSQALYSRYIKIRDADRHLSISWMTLKEWERAAKAIEQATGVAPRPEEYIDEASLTRFLRSLLHLEALIESDYLGDGFHMTIVLFRLAERSQYHLLRGDHAKAWHWVSQFAELMQGTKSLRVSPTTMPAFQTLLDVLLQFKRTDLVRSALTTAREWIDMHPVCRAAAGPFMELVEETAATTELQAFKMPSTAATTTMTTMTTTTPESAASTEDYYMSMPRQQHLSSDRRSGLAAHASERGRESGQDIPHGHGEAAEDADASGRESWSGEMEPQEGDDGAWARPQDEVITSGLCLMPQPPQPPAQESVSDTLSNKTDGRSSFDWSLFLQDLEHSGP